MYVFYYLPNIKTFLFGSFLIRLIAPTDLATINVHTLFCCQCITPYNMVKPKTFKPNLLDEPKCISSPEFFFIFAIFNPKLSLNRSKTADPLRFGLTVLYCTLGSDHSSLRFI